LASGISGRFKKGVPGEGSFRPTYHDVGEGGLISTQRSENGGKHSPFEKYEWGGDGGVFRQVRYIGVKRDRWIGAGVKE